MHTIYGGKTRNGVYIQDMVDNSNDYIYRYDSLDGYFARFSQYLKNKNDFNSGGPAIAIFADRDPYVPLFAKVLSEPWDVYMDQYGQMTDKFSDELKSYEKKVVSKIADFLK